MKEGLSMQLVVTMVAALVGAAILERSGLPAGALVGAMVGVALVNLSSLSAAELPRSAEFLSLAAIGWVVGQSIDGRVLRLLVTNASTVSVAVLLLVFVGGVVAMFLVKFGGLGVGTAFLATSPGGLSQMSALSASVGADAALVVTFHVTRVVVVVVAAPLVLRLLPTSG